jgi:hypothetical protein
MSELKQNVFTQDLIKTMSAVQAQELAKALGPLITGERQIANPAANLPHGMGHYQNYKASGNPASDAYLYVNGGLFGRCDSSPTLINALVGPIGFEAVLDWVGTNTEHEFVEAVTGVPVSGSESTTPCGDCPTVDLQACEQLYCFGRFCRQTQELQFDRIGLHGNGQVPTKILFGNIVDASGNVLARQGDAVENIWWAQSRLAGYHLALKNSQLLWNGDPCNNSGSYQEYKGFQNIINTGKFDAKTEIPCSAMDSFLMNMNFANFTSDGANAIRRWFKRMVDQFEFRASRAGFDWNSAEMHIVMHPNMWDCVARVYACAGIDLCSISANNNRFTANADQAQTRHEEFITRRALPIGGRFYPVVLDSEIPDTTGQANGVCSDIYFITTRISGQTVTWGQYQDFNQTFGSVHRDLVSLFGSDHIHITDNGRFAMVFDNSRGCFDVQILTKPRVISSMPWLSGRIQNVCCDILQQPFPDTSGTSGVYEVDGGRSTTPIPTLYSDCINC